MQYKNRHYNKNRNKADKMQINAVLYYIILAAIVLIFNISGLIAYFTSTVSAQNAFTINAEYEIIFNSNGGTGTMPNQRLSYNVQTPLSANLYTRQDYIFYNWNTEPDGSGTSYSNQEGVTNLIGTNNQPVTLYAQWVIGNPVAEIDGQFFVSLQDAINSVTTPNLQTTIKLLRDTSEVLTVGATQDIVFNLQNYTISNSGSAPVLENYGKVKMTNGTIRTNVGQGAINNERNATFIMTGGSIIAETSGSRQCIYNNGGTVEISGTAYLSTESNARAAVQNLNGGTLNVTGGTIIATRYYGIQNVSTMTIGTLGGEISKTSPVIQGSTYGINSTANYSFYDGIAKGKTRGVNDVNKITNKEPNYDILYGEEEIGEVTYHTAFLARVIPVHFSSDGGYLSEANRNVEYGDELGTLPETLKAGHDFLGWFTEPNGGTQITANIVPTAEVTYYAHWSQEETAEVDGVRYLSLADAIDAVQTNGPQKTITLLRDTYENATIVARKDIVLDLGNYTVRSAGHAPIFTNNGTLTITNGTIQQRFDFAAINSINNGKVIMTGGNIISTGGKAALYASENARIEISGTAYLSSNCSGEIDGHPRATVQAISDRTKITITGGTIEATDGIGVSTEGSLTIGDKDGVVSTTSPSITAKEHGVYCTNTFNFYDGIIRGETDAIDGTITDVETGYQQVDDTETIGGVTYQTAYLDQI